MVQLLLSMVEEDGGRWNENLGIGFCIKWDGRSVTGEGMSKTLKEGVQAVGQARLGLEAVHISCHSIRSGGCMAMMLSGVSQVIIQKIGRWLDVQ